MNKSRKRSVSRSGSKHKYIVVDNIDLKVFTKFSLVFSFFSSVVSSLLFLAGVLLGLPSHRQMVSTYGMMTYAFVLVFYFLSVFLSSVVFALVYNASARFVGGVRLKTRGD